MATKAFLEQAYLAYFGRPIDPNGVAAFVNATETEVENAFWASPESQALYGSVFGLQQINMVYNILFGRDAEPAGLAYWANQIVIGNLTPAGAAIGILRGALNDDVIAVNNKLAASAAFTAGLDTTEEILGFSGDAAAAVAREWLQTVTMTPATQEEVDAAIAAAVAVGGVTGGETFTLTTGIDAIVGTAGNDIVNAFLDGTDDTLQVFDRINGGSGVDTLKVLIADSASVTVGETTGVENLSLTLTNSAVGTGSTTMDMSLVSGLQNVALTMLSAEADGDFYLENLAANLDTLAIIGKDNSANSGSSDFDLYVNTSDATQLSIGTLSLSNMEGSVSVEIDNLTNIPVLSLSNISLNDSGSIDLEVEDSVGTGTADTLVINAENAGAMNYDDWTSVDISLYNESGDGVIENLTVTTAGTRGSSLSIDGTTSLENVTVSGSGDLALWLSDSDKVSVFDASGLAGDLTSELTQTVDAAITLGAGNDWFGIYAYDANTADAVVVTTNFDSGAGNDWIDIDGGTSDDMLINVATGAGNDIAELDSAGNAETITLGEGNDFFRLNSTLDNTVDTVSGGDGDDALILDAAELTADNAAALTDFEILVADSSGTYDLANLAGIHTLIAGAVDTYGIGPDAWWDPEETTDYWNLLGNADVLFDNAAAGVGLVLNYSNTQTVEVDLKTDGTANAMLVEIGNEMGDVSVGTLATDPVVVNDIETLTINSTGNDGDVASPTISDNAIQSLSATDMTKLVITGDSNLTLNGINLAGDVGSTIMLTKIDASAFTGKLTISEASNTASGVEFLGGSKADTYFGTLNGDTIKANAGADVITLGAGGAADTLVFGAGDSKVGAMDGYTGFVSGEDTIDLGAFGFSGTQSSAILDKGDINATIAAWTTTTTVADFFASVGVDRGVAISSDGANTYVVVDANADGNFTAADDMLVMLTGTATVALPDFGF